MSYRHRYDEHRVRTSLQSHVGRASADSDLIERYARDAYHENFGIYFTEAQLRAMPWDTRAFIESQARKIYGPRRERG